MIEYFYNLIISIIGGLIAVIISVKYTYEKQIENQINNSLEKTLKETINNYIKISLSEILFEYNRIEEIAKKKKKDNDLEIWAAFRKEENPFSNISNLQYLVIEESSYFLNNYARLYPREKRIKIGYLKILIEEFVKINNCIYSFERDLHRELNKAIIANDSDEDYNDTLQQYLSGFDCCFDECTPEIEKYYPLLNPQNKGDLFFKRKYLKSSSDKNKTKLGQFINFFKKKKDNMEEESTTPSPRNEDNDRLLNEILNEIKSSNKNTHTLNYSILGLTLIAIIISVINFVPNYVQSYTKYEIDTYSTSSTLSNSLNGSITQSNYLFDCMNNVIAIGLLLSLLILISIGLYVRNNYKE